MQTNSSEIARLREQIEEQLVAMRRGLSGLSAGSTRHDFITARMERIGSYQEDLTNQVGEDAATQLVFGLYNEVMDGHKETIDMKRPAKRSCSLGDLNSWGGDFT